MSLTINRYQHEFPGSNFVPTGGGLSFGGTKNAGHSDWKMVVTPRVKTMGNTSTGVVDDGKYDGPTTKLKRVYVPESTAKQLAGNNVKRFRDTSMHFLPTPRLPGGLTARSMGSQTDVDKGPPPPPPPPFGGGPPGGGPPGGGPHGGGPPGGGPPGGGPPGGGPPGGGPPIRQRTIDDTDIDLPPQPPTNRPPQNVIPGIAPPGLPPVISIDIASNSRRGFGLPGDDAIADDYPLDPARRGFANVRTGLGAIGTGVGTGLGAVGSAMTGVGAEAGRNAMAIYDAATSPAAIKAARRAAEITGSGAGQVLQATATGLDTGVNIAEQVANTALMGVGLGAGAISDNAGPIIRAIVNGVGDLVAGGVDLTRRGGAAALNQLVSNTLASQPQISVTERPQIEMTQSKDVQKSVAKGKKPPKNDGENDVVVTDLTIPQSSSGAPREPNKVRNPSVKKTRRCKGTSRSGEQCKKMTSTKSGYCVVHTTQKGQGSDSDPTYEPGASSDDSTL